MTCRPRARLSTSERGSASSTRVPVPLSRPACASPPASCSASRRPEAEAAVRGLGAPMPRPWSATLTSSSLGVECAAQLERARSSRRGLGVVGVQHDVRDGLGDDELDVVDERAPACRRRGRSRPPRARHRDLRRLRGQPQRQLACAGSGGRRSDSRKPHPLVAVPTAAAAECGLSACIPAAREAQTPHAAATSRLATRPGSTHPCQVHAEPPVGSGSRSVSTGAAPHDHGSAFRHDAFLYAGDEEFLARRAAVHRARRSRPASPSRRASTGARSRCCVASSEATPDTSSSPTCARSAAIPRA